MDKIVTKAKAEAPAAMAIVTTALQLLQSGTSVPGCPPAIAPVCAIALQVIQKTQETQQNQEACKELAGKISQIIVALVTPYAEQKVQDVPTAMQQNIERLRGDLDEISTKLDKVLRKKGFKRWVLSSHYKQEIAGYSSKLDWAINYFQFETILRMAGKIDILHSNSSGVASAELPNQILGLPPKPEIFYGRDEVVEEVVLRLVSTLNGRFSIGGPGGLGKTAVALTAVHDPRVVARFGSYRYWVPCERSTSASSLLRLLAESIKVPTSSTDLLALVVSELGREDAPKLVLLDNFETPWDVHEERQLIQTVLLKLVAVPSVSLLLTVRSEHPPCDEIDWTDPVLKPLDTLTLDAARQLYTRKHRDVTKDAALDALLSELSYMPLAVKLMAARGASGDTPQELLDEWRKDGIATLDRDKTRLGSIRVSIRLSTESRTMKDNPDALRLLSLLTLLPAGAPKHLLANLAPDMHPNKAFHDLQSVSLAYLNSHTRCVCLLSPIQQFIAEAHPPKEEQRDTVFKVYKDLLMAAGDKINSEKSWIPVNQALATHFPNVEAILLQRLKEQNPSDAIDLATRICLWNESPICLHLAQAALAAAELHPDPHLNAKCSYAAARILLWTDWRRSTKMMKDALVVFRGLKDQQYMLMCLKWIAENLLSNGIYEEAISFAEQAAGLAESLGNDAEYSRSLETLARISLMQGKLGDALVKMEQVDQVWQRTTHMRGDPQMIASLLIHAQLLRQSMRFDEAQEKLAEVAARSQGSNVQLLYEGWHQQELGSLHQDQKRTDEALAGFTAAAAAYRKGGYLEYALGMEVSVGTMLIRKAHETGGHCAGAKPVFERTLAEARAAGLQEKAASCSVWLTYISICWRCRKERNDESGLQGQEEVARSEMRWTPE